MRVLVTGATSGVGRDCVREFQQIDADVLAVSKSGGMNTLKIDFATPDRWPAAAFHDHFDVVVHCAAQVAETPSGEMFAANVYGPLDFFSRLRFTEGSLFVFISSTSVYAPPDPNSEVTLPTATTAPRSGYATSKLLFEFEFAKTIGSFGAPSRFLVLRTPTTLGSLRPGGFVSRWMDLADQGLPILISNPSARLNAVVDTKFLAGRIRLAASHQKPGVSIENAHSNGDINFIEAAELIVSLFGSQSGVLATAGAKPIVLGNHKASTDRYWNAISTRQLLVEHARW